MLAGLTLAAVGLPAVMGYSLIAGMPIVTGFYTFILPLVVFAMIGSSRHLIVAGDSASAALLAAGLIPLAAIGSRAYVVDAEIVALLVGAMLLAIRLARLSFLANFLARTILVGFLAGVGVQIVVAQIPLLTGLPVTSSATLAIMVSSLSHLASVQPVTMMIGLGALVAILIGRHYRPRVPWAFLVVTAAVALGWWMHRAGQRTTYIEAVRPGLPHPVLGPVPWAHLGSLSLTALAIVVVVIAQSAATSRAFAARLGERLDEGRDIVGLAAANVAAALSGAYPVNSSPTRAAIAGDAGATTRWVGPIAAVVALVVLLGLTGPLHYLPSAALAAVVVAIAVRLIDLVELKRLARLRRDEFVVALSAALAVIVVGIETGILIAAVLAVVNHLRRSYAPKNFLVVLDDDGAWDSRPVASRQAIRPGAYVYRFQASLWYANVGRFIDEVESLVDDSTRLLCLDFTSVAAIDYSAGLDLANFLVRLPESLVLRFTHVDAPVAAQLLDYGVTDGSLIRRSTRDVITEYTPPED